MAHEEKQVVTGSAMVLKEVRGAGQLPSNASSEEGSGGHCVLGRVVQMRPWRSGGHPETLGLSRPGRTPSMREGGTLGWSLPSIA